MSVYTPFDPSPDFLNLHAGKLLLGFVMTMGVGGYKALDAVLNRPVRHRDFWQVPDRRPVPALLRQAKLVSERVERADTTWSAEMHELQRLISEQNPREFDLQKEIQTNDALIAYMEKLLDLGEQAERSFVRLQADAGQLDAALQQAPAQYMALAAEARRYAAEAVGPGLKKDYANVADIWEAKAKAAAAHRQDVAANLNPELLAYLRERNLLLERILTMLNNGLTLGDLRRFAEFRKALQEVVHGHEFFSELLRTWRARVLGEAPAEPAGEARDGTPAEPGRTVRGGAAAPDAAASATLPLARR